MVAGRTRRGIGPHFRKANLMKAATWSAIAAWVALGIGLINLWFGVVRPWWRGRAASPAAQLDLLRYPKDSGWQDEVRVVVTDHGPAVMEKIDVQVFDVDGSRWLWRSRTSRRCGRRCQSRGCMLGSRCT